MIERYPSARIPEHDEDLYRDVHPRPAPSASSRIVRLALMNRWHDAESLEPGSPAGVPTSAIRPSCSIATRVGDLEDLGISWTHHHRA